MVRSLLFSLCLSPSVSLLLSLAFCLSPSVSRLLSLSLSLSPSLSPSLSQPPSIYSILPLFPSNNFISTPLPPSRLNPIPFLLPSPPIPHPHPQVVQTIIRSLPDMANILALLLIVNFIFSVIGVDMFGKQLPQYFGSIGECMFTLFVLMTQDGWVDIYREMEREGLALTGAIYFVIYIIIGALVFANIIVGVTVTNLQFAYMEMKEIKQVHHRQLVDNKFEQSNQVSLSLSLSLCALSLSLSLSLCSRSDSFVCSNSFQLLLSVFPFIYFLTFVPFLLTNPTPPLSLSLCLSLRVENKHELSQ